MGCSINGARIIEFLYMNKINLGPCLKPNPKINSRWMIDLKCKGKGDGVGKGRCQGVTAQPGVGCKERVPNPYQKTTAWAIAPVPDLISIKARYSFTVHKVCSRG